MKKYDKYQKWINKIGLEVLNLSFSLEVWEQLTAIQNNSKHFKKCGGHLQKWLDENYVYKVIMQISKLTDGGNRKDDINFIKLLKELKENKYISFERFLLTYNKKPAKYRRKKFLEKYHKCSMYKTNITIDDAKSDFKNITGFTPKKKNFDDILEKDIKKLNRIYYRVKPYRHKYVAHLTKTKIKKILTYDDISNCIKILKEITRKYHLLLLNCDTNFSYYDLDIKTVLKKPWIDD